jgi:F-type H+-transporting ATPase subunit a
VHLSPDQIIYWQYGFFKLNATIVFTWIVMVLLVVGSILITKKLTIGLQRARWQNLLEIIVIGIEQQIQESGLSPARKFIPFLGTLFLFISAIAILAIVPGFELPTGSLSTTAGLAFCVFVSVPFYGIQQQGINAYLHSYTQPSIVMLPFNIISELSRTLALAVRLFGNMMSGAMILAVLLTITPFIFPVIMSLLGLLTGMVQAYIFSILAAVYISAATCIHVSRPEKIRRDSNV